MKMKICEYCGTEYSEDQIKCPLCGKCEGEELPVDNRKPTSDKVPQWMWVLTCVLLGLAVVIGFVYFIVSMKTANVTTTEPVISAPVVETPAEEEIEVPAVVVEPEDLSCTELFLSQEELVMDEQGGHVFLTAVPKPYGCEDEVLFSSLDEEIAVVDEIGMITAISAGETEIIVTCGDITASCVVICDFAEEETEEELETEEPAEEETPEEKPDEQEETKEEPQQQAKPELSSVDFTLFHPGEETVLTVKNAPEGANITYTTSDASVVTVTDTGKVTAVGDGTAVITVTVNGETLTCYARCRMEETTENNDTTENRGTTENVPAVYKLSHVDVTFARYGETFYLSLRDGAGNKVSGASFSSNNSAVCSVDANGLVTATGRGMTRVMVSYGGTTYSCDIHCEYLQ